MIRKKNFEMLIKCHHELLKKGIRNLLFILGEGTERNRLEKLIKELGVSNTVKLCGFQKNPYNFLKKADVFVLSSIYEGLPTVVIESLALGIPVVSTNCPSGSREILDNGVYGKLVAINDIAGMVASIEEIILNENIKKSLSEKGIERANDFDIDKVVLAFESFFLKL